MGKGGAVRRAGRQVDEEGQVFVLKSETHSFFPTEPNLAISACVLS